MSNFGRLDILCVWFGHPSEKLWAYEFLENFCCSILSVSIYHGPQSFTYVKSYGPLNWTRTSVFNFKRLDNMCLNWTSELKVMTLWISRALQLFNFERLDISLASTVHPFQKLWPFELDQSFRVQFWESWYIMCLNRTSEWNVMTIWNSTEHLLFNY